MFFYLTKTKKISILCLVDLTAVLIIFVINKFLIMELLKYLFILGRIQTIIYVFPKQYFLGLQFLKIKKSSHNFYKCLDPHGDTEDNPKCCNNYTRLECGSEMAPHKNTPNQETGHRAEQHCKHTNEEKDSDDKQKQELNLFVD